MFIGFDLSVPGIAVGSAQTVAASAGDPFQESTFLLMGVDDQPDTGTTFTNEALYGPWGINAWPNTMEAKGDAQADTGAPIAGDASILMTATGNGSVLTTAPVQLYAAASQAFTWEGKAVVDNTVTTELWSAYNANTTSRIFRILANASGKLQFVIYETNGSGTTRLNLTGTSTSIPNGTAFWWAVERQADGTVTLFIDGTADTTTGTFTGEIGPSNGRMAINSIIGTPPGSGQQDYTADELRCTLDARYGGADYTPPADKFPRHTAPTAGANEQWFTTAGADTFTVPAGVSSIVVECWGAGGGGSGSADGAGGGGGGAYSKSTVAVTPESTIDVSVGAGGGVATAGGDTTFDTTVVVAKGGGGGSGSVGGAGGAAASGTGDTKFSGGSAQTCGGIGANGGGGGGSAASDAANGNTGLRNPTANLSSGGRGGREASYTNFPGGSGGNGGAVDCDGGHGQFPGGGGGGRGGNGGVDYGYGAETDGLGADGAIRITW